MERVKHKKRRKWWLRFFAIFMSICLLVSGYFFYQVWGAMNQSFDPLNRDKSDKRDSAVSMDEPFSVLILGTDVKDESKPWRSDVIMVATINPHEKSMKMLSIPRDTYAEIANSNGVKTKINAAPVYGQQSGVGPVTNTVYTVENFLNIPIDYYVKVNFTGFMEVVDALGGVEVNIPFTFTTRNFGEYLTYQEGPAHLDGRQALGYVRMRKQDPRGDSGRNDRQREVLQSLMEQALSVKSISKVDDILRSVGNNVTHDFEINQFMALQSIYSEAKNQSESVTMEGFDDKNNPRGIWFHYVSDEERLRVSNLLREHLELDLETLDGNPYNPEQDPANQEGTPSEQPGQAPGTDGSHQEPPSTDH
ncbi:LCP family glycopolymer transferase [Desmospora profundinema]|uniref:LCP family protein required for cell wall assembly n=1 Tax=Desmospora profundinema TaxID=1571184 RepID=A0ABU1IS74_9BACL|nr:LCP family protein [Desmospora profundinema]MDR6227407.1 LCP family protein required for cell wall assembly [Desmospora profundinema]